jgi:hypothetical protein
VKTERPPILYGAVILAALSLAWSGYAIADLMHSGRFGLSVALAGDIGWITVLWAEYKGITIAGKRWAAPAAGWAIALGVALLLVFHGQDAGGRAQAVAGPFVVLVGKTVWAFALAALRDPAAPTPEQQAELTTVMRDSAHQAAMLHARAQARICAIRAEASVTLARDETDFEIGLERLEKQAELTRRRPIALDAPPAGRGFDEVAEQAIEVIGEHPEQAPNTPSMLANTPAEQIASSPVNRANTDPEPPSIADLAREQVAITPSNADAIRAVMAALPDANKDSVAAAVRRERRRTQPKDGYA